MKTSLNKLLVASSFVLLALSSCKKNDAVLTATSGVPGVLTASATTLVLSSANLTNTSTIVETLSFVEPSFGYNAAVTNTLQIDVPSDNFASPKYTVTLSPNVFSQGYNTPDFNALMLKAGLKGGVTGTVAIRIVSNITNTTNYVYSNTVTLTVTPFNLTSYIYVTGAFQGWNATSPDSLVSATGNGTYVGIINFTAGNNQFLILPAKNFTNKYSTNDVSTPSTTVTYNAPNNLIAPSTAGQYLVTYNQSAGTITFALANTYSVIGSTTPGGNYSTDLEFGTYGKYVNNVNGYWTGVFPETAGAFKIRQNDDWTYSWGDITPADGKDATSNNGANINVAAAGNYLITFTIPPTARSGSFVLQVLTTYTLTKQ